jgi:hypothetical protein
MKLKDTTRESLIKWFQHTVNMHDELVGINHKIKCAEIICKLEGYDTEAKERVKARDFKSKPDITCPITGDKIDAREFDNV